MFLRIFLKVFIADYLCFYNKIRNTVIKCFKSSKYYDLKTLKQYKKL